MQSVPLDVWAAYERRLEQAQVPADQRSGCLKWVRCCFDFCRKYGHSLALPTSLGPFLTKLASKATMIYLQTVPNVTLKEVKSPLHCL
jgi:hypothetical protein